MSDYQEWDCIEAEVYNVNDGVYVFTPPILQQGEAPETVRTQNDSQFSNQTICRLALH